MRLGIIGKSKSGKTTLFNLLTGLEAAISDFSGKIEPNLGNIKVPDERVTHLSSIYQPAKTTHAVIDFVDVPAPPSPDQAAQTAVYQHIRNCQALVGVIRCFHNPISGDAVPSVDYAELSVELILNDQIILENRLTRLKKEKGKTSDPTEITLIEKCLRWVEAEKPLRLLELSEVETKKVAGYQFLSLKPLMCVLNVAEQVVDYAELETLLKADSVPLIVINSQLELEISLLDEEDRPLFMEEMGISEVARDQFIQAAYQLLNLVSFFTVGKDEVKAWTVKAGTLAPIAGGAIHSDIQRGFIRAETISYEDFKVCGSEAAAKKEGKARSEGKEYVVSDGDIINFRFNV